ncbi:MAG: hypothetical protein ACRENO_08130, partial [Thermodesulfobacteriota bacterium]
VYALLDDLFFESKIRNSAKRLDIDLSIIKDKKSFDQKISEEIPNLIIIDLISETIDAEKIVNEIEVNNKLKIVSIIGYLPHVETNLISKFVAGRCSLVVPRSRFSREMDHLIKRYL